MTASLTPITETPTYLTPAQARVAAKAARRLANAMRGRNDDD